jgi:hypothetical protein
VRPGRAAHDALDVPGTDRELTLPELSIAGTFCRAEAQSARADDLAGIQLEGAGQALQQGRLAGAVLADQRRARVVEQERDVLEHLG